LQVQVFPRFTSQASLVFLHPSSLDVPPSASFPISIDVSRIGDHRITKLVSAVQLRCLGR
jgi:hypothetical protein